MFCVLLCFVNLVFIDNVAEFVNLSWIIADCKYVLMYFNILKERSPSTIVIGIVKYNLYVIINFDILN